MPAVAPGTTARCSQAPAIGLWLTPSGAFATLGCMVSRPHFQRLVDRVRALPPLPAAVVYPCDGDALQMALSGQFAGYLAPVLVGPEKRIAEAAAIAGLDLSRVQVVDTADDPFVAAQRAAALARDGEVRALVKGTLYPDDLMRAIASPESGLRSERRLTHAYFVEVPTLPRAFVLSDTVLNIAPTLAAKRDIVQNAIEFSQALGTPTPNVAVLSAVEGVTPAIPASADAAALQKMARQGLITGAVVEGPITADVAFSSAAARSSSSESKISGAADVLIVPNLECGAILLRTLTGAFGALAAGVALGARVPIVLPARGESMEMRMASCMLASVFAHAPRESAAESNPPAAARATTDLSPVA